MFSCSQREREIESEETRSAEFGEFIFVIKRYSIGRKEELFIAVGVEKPNGASINLLEIDADGSLHFDTSAGFITVEATAGCWIVTPEERKFVAGSTDPMAEISAFLNPKSETENGVPKGADAQLPVRAESKAK